MSTEPEEESKVVESPLSQRLTRNGVTVAVEIYGDGEGEWILEVVDEESCSHVWDDRFPSDRDAFVEALRALDEEPLEFAARDGRSTTH
jgi:hypothetical protein